MTRTTSTTLLLAGAVLLTSRLVSPASSAPQPRRVEPETTPQTSPALAEVNAEVDRLHDRLSVVPDFPPPSRDPFAFGRAPERARALTAPSLVVLAPAAPPVAPALPELVAILSPTEGSAPADRSAVLAIGEDVQFKKAGDDVGAFRVESVTADALVLVDRDSRAVFTIPLH